MLATPCCPDGLPFACHWACNPARLDRRPPTCFLLNGSAALPPPSVFSAPPWLPPSLFPNPNPLLLAVARNVDRIVAGFSVRGLEQVAVVSPLAVRLSVKDDDDDGSVYFSDAEDGGSSHSHFYSTHGDGGSAFDDCSFLCVSDLEAAAVVHDPGRGIIEFVTWVWRVIVESGVPIKLDCARKDDLAAVHKC
ncbi:hypothetical protein Ahy_B10g100423 [Arachis hypogaea]|uniref:Uncharacterized protein n=1 Tax=Arachis hypogaea TaxID=3818 RepID=A0A444WWN6_ARAHY|nr:hypothetical protein Ahy_B10g100423 [Arachis hypogaea]